MPDLNEDTRAKRIGETYDSEGIDSLALDIVEDGENIEDAIRRVLKKAADCLRGGATATFTSEELDLVRHMMPAHVVHQSVALKWWHQHYGAGQTS